MIADAIIFFWQIASMAVILGPAGWWIHRFEVQDKLRWEASGRRAPFGAQTAREKAIRWSGAIGLLIVGGTVGGTMWVATGGVYRALSKASLF